MKPRFATKDEIKRWNELIIHNPDGGTMFSCYEFAIQKLSGGYKAHFMMVDNLAVTILEKSFPLLGKFWYLPKGPGLTDANQVIDFLNKLKEFAKKNGVFAIRIEPEVSRDNQILFENNGLYKTRSLIPNSSTIILDIRDNLDDLLLKLPQNGRYAIRRAERDGVKVKLVEATDNNCQTMYRLLKDTAEGQFGIRSYEYFRTFWQRYETAGTGQLFFAYFDNQVVAGAFAVTIGKKSTYKDGASIRKKTAYGASHLLQWSVIKWAKSKGSNYHDLCGSPPSDKINDESHKHYRIGLFKTSFSKIVTDYVGCYDFAINNIKYKIWIKFAEKVATRLHYYKYHDSYY